MTHVLLDMSFINIIILAYNTLPFQDIPIQGTSWSDKVWSVIILIILYAFIKNIYDTWGDEGAISEYDYDLMRRRKYLSFYKAAIAGSNIKSVPLADIETSDCDNKYELYHLDTTKDWHSEARDLLTMSSHQYLILDADWHSEKQAYLSYYSNNKILLYCSLHMPDDLDVESAIQYFNANNEDKITRVIVAVKEKIENKEEVVLDGCVVEFQCKDQMLDSLVDFSDYYAYLNDQFSKLEITEGDNLTLKDVYVESSADIIDLKNNENGQYIESAGVYLLDWAKEKEGRENITILGEYGQGKSVLSLKLALDVISEGIKRAPIIIELRGKSPRNETVATIIASWALQFNINVKAMQKLLQEGRLIIILEGFDELDMVGNSHRRLEHFKKLWEFARYKKSKVIITGRPNLFLDNNEAREYLHLDNDQSDLFKVVAIHLKPFTKSKIENALRSVDPVIKSEVIALYDKNEGGFSDLISRPSTLYQTSVIWNVLDKDNINSASVINEFINHAYRRQEEKLQSLGPTGVEPPVLTSKERDYFMLGVAVGMIQESGYSNQISRNELNRIVLRLFFEMPDHVSNDHSTGISLQTRLNDDPDALDSVFNDVRATGILTRDLTGVNTFKFAHKSFLELLFARYFVGQLPYADNEALYNSISNALGIEGGIYKLEYSDEVISHITELLAKDIKVNTIDEKSSIDLLNKINPNLILTDTLLFRKYLGVSLPVVIVSVLIVVLLSLKVTNRVEMDIDVLGGLSIPVLLIEMTLLSVFVIGVSRQRVAKNMSSSYEIWRAACSKMDYDSDDSTAISKPFVQYLNKNYGFLDKVIISFRDNNSKVLEDALKKVGVEIVKK